VLSPRLGEVDVVVGPRTYPSDACLTWTTGHRDRNGIPFPRISRHNGFADERPHPRYEHHDRVTRLNRPTARRIVLRVDLADRVDLSDADVFTASVREHWSAMRRVAERLAGRAYRDDVLQDALADAWRHRGSFDASRGSLGAWLVTITANRARKSFRSRRDAEPLEDVAVDRVDYDVDLQRAVRALPSRQRLAVELYYFVGLSISEVAAAMSCAVGTVKSTLAAARTNLQRSLGTAGDDDR
jgi:RNA polymerase sigma factor (sigma-70 family)